MQLSLLWPWIHQNPWIHESMLSRPSQVAGLLFIPLPHCWATSWRFFFLDWALIWADMTQRRWCWINVSRLDHQIAALCAPCAAPMLAQWNLLVGVSGSRVPKSCCRPFSHHIWILATVFFFFFGGGGGGVRAAKKYMANLVQCSGVAIPLWILFAFVCIELELSCAGINRNCANHERQKERERETECRGFFVQTLTSLFSKAESAMFNYIPYIYKPSQVHVLILNQNPANHSNAPDTKD